jgi:hypothetical protein
MPAIKHVHTYIRYKARPNWYRCAAPNCTHHIDKEVLLGKLSLCNSCGAEMILSREDLRRAKPKCLNCSDTKKAKLHQKAQELTKYLGTEHFDPLNLALKTDQGVLFPSTEKSVNLSPEELELDSSDLEEEEEEEEILDEEEEFDDQQEEFGDRWRK